MNPIIPIELLSIVFGLTIAMHDVPSIDNFTYYGSNAKDQALFHSTGFTTKFLYIIAIAMVFYSNHGLKLTILLSICNWAIIWCVFDPIIASERKVFSLPKKPWYYLSLKSNRIDTLLIKLLGNKAGIYKTVACIVIIIVINFIILRR